MDKAHKCLLSMHDITVTSNKTQQIISKANSSYPNKPSKSMSPTKFAT